MYPGIRASISFSARSTIVAIKPLRYSLIVAASSSYQTPQSLSATNPFYPSEHFLIGLRMRQQRAYEPKPQVSRDLIVPASTGMKLSSDVLPDDFREPSLVGGVDVLVVGLGIKLSVARKVRNEGQVRRSAQALSSPFLPSVPLHCPHHTKRNKTLGRAVQTFFSSHSFLTSPKPRSISSLSCCVRISTFSNAFAYAMDPRISARYILWSYFRHCCMLQERKSKVRISLGRFGA